MLKTNLNIQYVTTYDEDMKNTKVLFSQSSSVIISQSVSQSGRVWETRSRCREARESHYTNVWNSASVQWNSIILHNFKPARLDKSHIYCIVKWLLHRRNHRPRRKLPLRSRLPPGKKMSLFLENLVEL